MISIIIPVYNQAKKLDECLRSIKKQTYNKYEVIIVNDGSTDNLSEVIKKYQETFGYRLEYFEQENMGAPSARNTGANKARGEYLLFCDADLIMEPKMLEIMLLKLKENSEAGFIYSSHRYGYKLFKLWPFDADKLKQMPYIHSTSLMRRKAFPNNGWDKELKKLQDWDFWLTVVENGWNGAWINKTLFTIQPGGTYSNWLPSFSYKFFPFLTKVKKYNEAVKIVKQKHGLL